MFYELILFCIFAFLVLVGILVWLLIKKAVDNLIDRKQKNYRNIIYPRLSKYVSHGGDLTQRLLNPGSSWKKNIIIDILGEIAGCLKSDEEFRQIQKICVEIGLIDHLAGKLRNPRWWIATQATRKVQRFKLESLIPDLSHNLHSSHYHLWTASARALSKMNQNRLLIEFLVENQHQLKEWSIIRIGDILSQSDGDDVDILMEHIDSDSPILTKLFIQILGKRKAVEAIPAIEHYLDTTNQKELLLSALQAVAEIRITTRPDRIVQLLASSEWEVRMWAIRVIQSCGMIHEIPILVDILADSSWWVRLRCAETLYSFGPFGIEILQQAAKAHSDEFARDIAYKVLQDKGMEVRTI